MLTKELIDFLVVSLHLGHKLVGVLERRERMGIGLREEFHASGVGKFLHRLDEFRHILLKLLQSRSTDRESHLEAVAILLNHVEQHLVGGQVRPVRDARDNVIVGKVVVIVVVVTDIKETVILEPERLMYLEIETNNSHIVSQFNILSVIG